MDQIGVVLDPGSTQRHGGMKDAVALLGQVQPLLPHLRLPFIRHTFRSFKDFVPKYGTFECTVEDPLKK